MANAAAATSLTLTVERHGTKATVHCRGRLVAGVGHKLYDCVHELLPEAKCITLDLTELAYVDSMGLGTLVRIYCSAKAQGSRLELVNLGKQIRELLGITNLLSVFSTMCEQGVTMKF